MSDLLIFIVLCTASMMSHVQCFQWIYHKPANEWDTGRQWGKSTSGWRSLGAAKDGDAAAFENGARGHVYDDRNHAGFAYGSKGASDGFTEFAKHAADGHIADAVEAGEHALSGAEGHKKYSYFTEGSGPNGFYSKGYFGTNGYDHSAAKEAHVKDANHGGFEKGYEHAGADHGFAHSAWDKVARGKDNHEHVFDQDSWKQGAKEWSGYNHGDNWKGSMGEHLYDHHHSGEDGR